MVKEWDRRDTSRRKALSQLQTKSPMPNASRFAKELSTRSNSKPFFLCSEQKAYLEKVKQERLVKEELMSQDDEEDIPVTEREMNLKVKIKMLMMKTMMMTMMMIMMMMARKRFLSLRGR